MTTPSCHRILLMNSILAIKKLFLKFMQKWWVTRHDNHKFIIMVKVYVLCILLRGVILLGWEVTCRICLVVAMLQLKIFVLKKNSRKGILCSSNDLSQFAIHTRYSSGLGLVLILRIREVNWSLGNCMSTFGWYYLS